VPYNALQYAYGSAFEGNFYTTVHDRVYEKTEGLDTLQWMFTLYGTDARYSVTGGTAKGGSVAIIEPTTGTFRYTPPAGFVGWDSFTCNVTTSEGSADAPQKVFVLVTNAVPEAQYVSYSTAQDTPKSGQVSAYDPNDDPVKIRPAVQPAHGRLDLHEDGTFTYTPNNGFAGVDAFSFFGNDGVADGGIGTAYINVTKGNGKFVTLSASDPVAKEGATPSDPAKFTVTRTDTTGPLTVPFLIDPISTASSGDYQLTGTATFAAGQSQAILTIQPNDDSIAEWTETVVARIKPGSGYTIYGPATATAEIMDNDSVDIILDGMGEAVEDTTGAFKPIDPEDDEPRIPLQLSNLPQGQKADAFIRLTAASAHLINIYTTPTGGYPIIGGVDFAGGIDSEETWAAGSSVPSTLYVQPSGQSSDLRDVQFTLEAVDVGGLYTSSSSDIAAETNWAIVDVSWSGFAASPLDANTQQNGGLRIFPDQTKPGDTTVRDLVYVVATVSPAPPAGTVVHFGSFDPDDPYIDSTGEIDTNDGSGPQGYDNRGASPGKRGTFPSAGINYRTTGTTDVFGKASVVFQVTKQPGDNFRVAASHSNSELDKLWSPEAPQNLRVVTPDSAQPAGWTGKLTDLLTVWRRLWIERDSMLPASPQGSAGSISVTLESVTPGAGTAGDTVTFTNAVNLDGVDQYEGGTLSIPALGLTLPVYKSTDNSINNDYVRVPGGSFTAAQVASIAAGGVTGTLTDDDALVLPHLPSGGTLIESAFGNAYIKPIYVDAGAPDSPNSVGTIPFVRHLHDDFSVASPQLTSGPLYWATLVVGAYENKPETDGDPDGVAALVRGAPVVEQDKAFDYGVSPTGGTNVSLIYLETIDDFARQGAIFTDEAHTVVHEIGHTAGTGIDGHNPNWTGIMQAGAPVLPGYFDNVHLAFMRSVATW
jgi:hypothetical protein